MKPLVIEPGAHDGLARIVATQEDRMMVGTGDEAFVTGIPDASVEKWNVFRPGKPLKDPETGEIIAHEAFFLGNARLVKPGEPAAIRITLAKEEVRIGDRLLPAPPPEWPVFVPHAPEPEQQGQVVSVYGNAVRYAGQSQVVTINRGARDGVEPGQVLTLLKESGVLPDKTDPGKPELRLPGERNGLMIVFRVFERVSYALLLQITDGVKIGDRFITP